MARIAGVEVPPQKRLWVGLTAIYGIGQSRARKICEQARVEHTKKVSELTEDEINRLRQTIEQQGGIEGDIRKELQMNIRRLIDIQSYRGLRHRRNLPVRGQRTHTNARTRKGPRRGAVATRKKAAVKK
jgi:small subunit ribosomal protein S13